MEATYLNQWMNSEQCSYGKNEIMNFVGKWMELEGIMRYCFPSIVHDLVPLLYVFSYSKIIIVLLCKFYSVPSMLCILPFFWLGFLLTLCYCLFMLVVSSIHQLSCTSSETLRLAETLSFQWLGRFSMTGLFGELNPWANECVIGISPLSVSMGTIPCKWFL